MSQPEISPHRTPRQRLRFLDAAEIPTLAAQFSTPLFVYDEARLRESISSLLNLPAAFGMVIRYSLKSNPSAAMIALAATTGVEFDASSVWEVKRAVRAGVAPSKILLTAQEAKFTPDLIRLIEQGLQFDAGSLIQLEQYGEHFPGSSVSIRINPGFGSGLVRRLTSGGPESSFGIWHEHLSEVKSLVERFDLQITRLHTHIGSGHHADVLLPAAELLISLAAGDFPEVTTINLGGGYRISAFAEDPRYDHSEWAAELKAKVQDFAQENGRQLVVELEPGTYLTANAGSIISRVIDVTDNRPSSRYFIKIDSGLTEIIRPSFYGAPHPLVAVSKDGTIPADGPDACVAGHCCIAGDMLTNQVGNADILEPIAFGAVGVDDFVVIERSGGYTASMSLKNFNSYPEAAEVLRRADGSYQLIRTRQTIEQITANEQIPADLVADR